MAILYRTRGNSNPQGKQKVYFTCHQDDFDTYFEYLSEKILAKQNCAIWYYGKDENDEMEESNLEELEQMQLFVIPITGKFLQMSNRALNVEFAFAVKHHIPVLPIMMDSELDEIFQEKCGNLQYLDPNEKDDTVVSFDEKLDKYLGTVLIGDEIAAKIRAAFDAYIFMSYRKKDRKYAKELMRLIHNNPFCRDIAIWYDEYLTPGQDFNSEIEAALEKSDLFALVVTPHLLERNEEDDSPNYVARVEYPMAKAAEKDILPVEMVATDRDSLEKMYPDISEAGVVEGEAMLSESLLLAVQRLAIIENDNSPEHNFFIGLAYLGGVDVEVDYERAVRLIKGAAESDLEEAIEKLIQMYQTGEGVARNYEEALKWRKHLVELAENKYKTEQSLASFDDLIYKLRCWGDDARMLSHLSETKEIFEKMLRYCEEVYKRKKDRICYRNISVAYEKIGDVEWALKRYIEARSYYEKSFGIKMELLKENPTAQAKSAVSTIYERLGHLEQKLECYDQAREYFEKSLEIDLEVLEEIQTAQAKCDVSISYERLGDLEIALKHYDSARSYHEKSLEIRLVLMEEMPMPREKRSVLLSYEKLGDIERKLKCYDQARSYYEKSLEISAEILEETATLQARLDMAALYERFGDLEKALINYDGARNYHEKSLEIRLVLWEETSMPRDMRNVSVAYERLGDIAREQKHYDRARYYCEKSLEMRLQLMEENPIPDTQRGVSIAYYHMGRVEEDEKHYAAALEYYEKAWRLAGAIYEMSPTPTHQSDVKVMTKACNRIDRLLIQ